LASRLTRRSPPLIEAAEHRSAWRPAADEAAHISPTAGQSALGLGRGLWRSVVGKGPLLCPPRPPEPSPHPSRSTIRRTGQPLTASNAGDQLRLPCQPARSRRAIKTPAPRRCQSPARAAPRNAIAGVAYRPDRVAQSEHEACAFGGPSSSSVPASPLRALEPCPHRGVRLGDRRPGAGLRRGLVPLSSVLTVNSAGVQCICTVSIRNMHRDD
jgi:hypothetical protein